MTRLCRILIPGVLNDADLWRDQAAFLSSDFDVRVADITRGETLADLARTVLEDAPRTLSFAGFSLGDYVAQERLRQAPERIAASRR